MSSGDALAGHERISYRLGAICRVLSLTDQRHLPLAAVMAQILAPVRLDQVAILSGPRGIPLGFATWAYCSEAVTRALRADPDRLLCFPNGTRAAICG